MVIEMSRIRTDLAVEEYEIEAEKGVPDGIIIEEKSMDGITVTRTEICAGAGEQRTGKKAGIYTTVDTGRVWQYDSATFRNVAHILAGIIMEMLPETDAVSPHVLVAGLGNKDITSDSIGPKCTEELIVTRHIKEMNSELFEEAGFGELSAVAPGVLGKTGIESAEIVKSVADATKPHCLIVIDALASRRLSRLTTTVQITDVGLRPGSGVSNHRAEFDPEVMGIPVIAIGIPTVVDAATLAADLISDIMDQLGESHSEQLFDTITENLMQGDGKSMFVTPKDSDIITDRNATLIATAINLAVHKSIPFDEMNEYIA